MNGLTLLSEKKLRAEYDRTSAARSLVTDELIAAGRGYERHSETVAKSDELSLRYLAAHEACAAVVAEQKRRMEWHGSLRPIRKLTAL